MSHSASIGKGGAISFGGTATAAVDAGGLKLPSTKYDIATFSYLDDFYKRKLAGQVDGGPFSVDVILDLNDTSQVALAAYFTGTAPTANTGVATVFTYPNGKTLTWTSVFEGCDFGTVDANNVVKATINGQVNGSIVRG